MRDLPGGIRRHEERVGNFGSANQAARPCENPGKALRVLVVTSGKWLNLHISGHSRHLVSNQNVFKGIGFYACRYSLEFLHGLAAPADGWCRTLSRHNIRRPD
jgi:hypothetical protein